MASAEDIVREIVKTELGEPAAVNPANLRTLLESRGLSTAGSKKELIARLAEAGPAKSAKKGKKSTAAEEVVEVPAPTKRGKQAAAPAETEESSGKKGRKAAGKKIEEEDVVEVAPPKAGKGTKRAAEEPADEEEEKPAKKKKGKSKAAAEEDTVVEVPAPVEEAPSKGKKRKAEDDAEVVEPPKKKAKEGKKSKAAEVEEAAEAEAEAEPVKKEAKKAKAKKNAEADEAAPAPEADGKGKKGKKGKEDNAAAPMEGVVATSAAAAPEPEVPAIPERPPHDSVKAKRTKGADKLFGIYQEPGAETIQVNGTINFLGDLNIDSQAVEALYLAHALSAKEMCVFNRDDFVKGFKALRCESIDDMKAALPSYIARIRDNKAEFKKFYQWAYGFGCEPGQKSINYLVASSLWKLLLGPKHTCTTKWCEFIDETGQKNVPKDTWNAIPDFFAACGNDISKLDPNDSWPVLCDEYAKWLKTNNK